ncbi:MAG: ABC transporter permease [Thermoprotei archaeon]|nr:ABC transporter permease [Thermoprotei archaeon]
MTFPRSVPIIAYRDLQRFWKYKWWLAGLITMNLADLLIFALVFRGIVRREVVPDYLQFIAPGIASIAAFAAAFTIGREVMVELRRDFHHYLLSLPISRLELVAGRIASGLARGLIYQLPFIVLIVILTRLPSPTEALIALSVSAMIAASMSSLSIALSTLARSLELQATIRGLVYFIVFFASNIFYPEHIIRVRFPEAVQIVIINNPISIATSIYRHIFTPHLVQTAYTLEELLLKLTLWTVILLLVGALLYERNLK